MSISEELQRIINAKSSIRNAIITKGVDVSTDLLLSSYADKILEITSGGGASQADLNNIIDSLRSRGLDVSSGIGWSDVPYYIELLVKATDAESADSDFLISDQLADNEIWMKTSDNQPVSNIRKSFIKDAVGNACNITYNYYDPNSGYCKVELDRNVYSVDMMFYNASNTVTTVIFSNYLHELGNLYAGQTGISKVIVGRNLTTLGRSFWYQPMASISLPSTLSTISDGTFAYTTIYKIKSYATTAPTLSGQPFYNISATGTVYIPKGADYSTWRNATGLSGWSFIDNL